MSADVPVFLALVGVEANKADITGLINLGAVRSVEDISDGYCRLVFSETHSVAINGSGADAVVKLLLKNAISVDGTPFPEFIQNAKTQSL